MCLSLLTLTLDTPKKREAAFAFKFGALNQVGPSLARIRTAYPQSSSPSSSRSAAAAADEGEQASEQAGGEAVTGLTASAADAAPPPVASKLNWASALEWVSRPSARPLVRRVPRPLFLSTGGPRVTAPLRAPHARVRACVSGRTGNGGASPREQPKMVRRPSILPPLLCMETRSPRRHGGREGKPITGELV